MFANNTLEANDSIRTLTIKTSDGKYKFVAQIGNNVLDRVGRVVGFRAKLTSDNFTSMAQADKWATEHLED